MIKNINLAAGHDRVELRCVQAMRLGARKSFNGDVRVRTLPVQIYIAKRVVVLGRGKIQQNLPIQSASKDIELTLELVLLKPVGDQIGADVPFLHAKYVTRSLVQYDGLTAFLVRTFQNRLLFERKCRTNSVPIARNVGLGLTCSHQAVLAHVELVHVVHMPPAYGFQLLPQVSPPDEVSGNYVLKILPIEAVLQEENATIRPKDKVSLLRLESLHVLIEEVARALNRTLVFWMEVIVMVVGGWIWGHRPIREGKSKRKKKAARAVDKKTKEKIAGRDHVENPKAVPWTVEDKKENAPVGSVVLVPKLRAGYSAWFYGVVGAFGVRLKQELVQNQPRKILLRRRVWVVMPTVQLDQHGVPAVALN